MNNRHFVARQVVEERKINTRLFDRRSSTELLIPQMMDDENVKSDMARNVYHKLCCA